MRYLKLISNFVLKSKIASKSKSAINATVSVLETCIPTYSFMYQKNSVHVFIMFSRTFFKLLIRLIKSVVDKKVITTCFVQQNLLLHNADFKGIVKLWVFLKCVSLKCLINLLIRLSNVSYVKQEWSVVSSKARTSVLVTLNKKNYDRSNSEFLKISKYHN